jgi:predicted nucleic acid-binding protein
MPVAVDASTLIAYIQGDARPDVIKLQRAIATSEILLPPVVVSEIFSDPKLPDAHRDMFLSLQVLEITGGYWQRAGELRARLLERKLKARLADTLIAQSCIDHDVPLIAGDGDFRHFADHGGLKLA